MNEMQKGLVETTLGEMCFPVELIDNPNKTNQEYSKIVVGTINRELVPAEIVDGVVIKPAYYTGGEDIDLNYCSPRYELVPNSDIFPQVENILNAHGIAFTANYSHTNHARFYGTFVIDDPRFGYKMKGTNDVIKFIWNFQHSYNGLTKYSGVAGFYRMICSNGLVVPVQEMEEYNLSIQGKHTASILKSLEQFSQILENVTVNLGDVKKSIIRKYEILGSNWIGNAKDRVEEVLKANKIAIIENSKFNTMSHILGTIMSEANDTGLGYEGRVNDWLIYNGINQYINDDSLNIKAPETRRVTDSKVLEYMLKYS